ncbi:MAG: response regulator transcription factor, partial [Calditrichia bacterium]|nr:response regulator transcription factor [Calditrichia bacterium]
MEKEKKILIVDDHEFIHDILDKMFALNGFDTVHAFNGKEGIEQVNKEDPDLVIMDQMMPVMDGLSATREIRKKYDGNRLPIIFFTAKNDKATLVEVLSAGANDYITKPFEKEELIARVTAHLRIRTLQGNLEKRTIELNEANTEINLLNKKVVNRNKQLRKRIYDLNNLFEVSIKFLSELNYEDVINTALLTILGLFGVKFVSVALKKEDENVYTAGDIKG